VLARNRIVRLLNGAIEFETPMLVPGLSSKALGPILAEQPGTHTLSLRVASLIHSESLIHGIEEALLVSSYDIKHDLLTDAKKLRTGFKTSRWSKPNLLIVDSGWYEKSVGPPGGQYVHDAGAPLVWEQDDFVKTIDAMDKNVRAVVVGWDSTADYSVQIAEAQEFFGGRKRFGSTILFKPPKTARFHGFKNLSPAQAADLRAFDIVGVTEKELGDSIMDRLVELAMLRSTLDAADVDAPVHVFGGLDPLYTPLYVAAGAEIFDGLGWLRYAYMDGRSQYRDASPLLDLQVTKRWAQAVSATQLHNLDEMAQLTEELKMFAHAGGDPSKLRSEVGDIVKPVLDRLEQRLKHG
jgi:hypothetical protein